MNIENFNQNYTLMDNFENNKNNFNTKLKKNTNIKPNIKHYNKIKKCKEIPVNNFPLAWTCSYDENNKKWDCPMDK
jgi:hypothetical protein